MKKGDKGVNEVWMVENVEMGATTAMWLPCIKFEISAQDSHMRNGGNLRKGCKLSTTDNNENWQVD